jgi:hypothetical protein
VDSYNGTFYIGVKYFELFQQGAFMVVEASLLSFLNPFLEEFRSQLFLVLIF